MQDDHLKQQRMKQNEKFVVDVFHAFKGLIDNFKTELSKNKSGLKIYQDPNGIVPEEPKTNLQIFQAGGAKEAVKNVFNQATEKVAELGDAAKEIAKTALNQATEKVTELGDVAKETALDHVEATARNFARDRQKQRDQGQSIEQAFAEVIAPEAEQPREKQPAPPEVLEVVPETDMVTPEAAPAKIKDRLLYANNNITPEMKMPDMLAVAELFTAQRGAQLEGDAAKNLIVEFNGQLLLKTDSEGRVQTNNLQNQEILSNFDFREKEQIADAVAQFEQLKPMLKKAIDLQLPPDIPKLTAEMEEKVKAANANIGKAEEQTPAVLGAASPAAKDVHQEIGSNRIDTQTPAIENQALGTTPKTPEALPNAKISADTPGQQPPSPPVAQEPASDLVKTHIRLAQATTIAFNVNYDGEIPAQGTIQTPTGTIIHKTIIDQESKAFDIAIERDGQRHQVASYRDGSWTIQEGMEKAEHLLREISTQINNEGEFMKPDVKPFKEVDQQQQDKYEPERDYAR
jgi:hypothetical protein